MFGWLQKMMAPTLPESSAVPPIRKRAGIGTLRTALQQGQPGYWASDHREESQHYTGWNYIAITAIARQAAQAEADVYSDGKDRRDRSARRKSLRKRLGVRWKQIAPGLDTPLDPDHRLSRLVHRPNPHQSGASFRYESVIQLQLTGNLLVWKVPNRLGKTTERYVVPISMTSPVNPSNELPRGGYRIQPDFVRSFEDDGFVEMASYLRAIGMILPAEQFQVIRWPHPMVKGDGYSPLAAGARQIDTAEMVDTSRWAQLRQGPDPSFAVTLAENIDPDDTDLDRYAQKLAHKYGGPQNHGKPFILGGVKQLEKLSTTPKEMAYTDAFTQLRDFIMALHSTPPIAAGVTEAGAYAAFYASLRQFTELAVQPILSLLAEEETEQIAPEFGEGLTVEYSASSIDDPDLLERQLATDIQGNGITVDELRELRGREPLGGEEGRKPAGTLSTPSPLQMQPDTKEEPDEESTGFPSLPQMPKHRRNGHSRRALQDAFEACLASSETPEEAKSIIKDAWENYP